MKKIYHILFFILSFPIFLSACTDETKQLAMDNLTESILSEENEANSISFSITSKSINSDTPYIDFILTNFSDKEYIYYDDPRLEVLINDKWYIIPNIIESEWVDSQFILLPSDSYYSRFSLEQFENNLYIGEYRLVQEVFNDDEKEFVIAPFEIK